MAYNESGALEISNDELQLFQNMITNTNVLAYVGNNGISVKPRSKLDRSWVDPIPRPITIDFIARAKRRGLDNISITCENLHHRIQSRDRDRTRNLPLSAIGRSDDGKYYFYGRGSGRPAAISLDTAFRVESKRVITSPKTGIKYHVLSFIKPLRGGIYHKNHSLKFLRFLMENYDYYKDKFDLIRFNGMLIKGLLFTDRITPDYVITIKSSKNINANHLEYWKADPYFKDTQFIEVEKPTYTKMKEFVDSLDDSIKSLFYDTDGNERFNKTLDDKDSIQSEGLSREERLDINTILQEYLKTQYDWTSIKDKHIVVFDDTLTTGSTLETLITLVEHGGNKIFPFSLIMIE